VAQLQAKTKQKKKGHKYGKAVEKRKERKLDSNSLSYFFNKIGFNFRTSLVVPDFILLLRYLFDELFNIKNNKKYFRSSTMYNIKKTEKIREKY